MGSGTSKGLQDHGSKWPYQVTVSTFGLWTSKAGYTTSHGRGTSGRGFLESCAMSVSPAVARRSGVSAPKVSCGHSNRGNQMDRRNDDWPNIRVHRLPAQELPKSSRIPE